MTRDELREALLPLPVWDTHTHLVSESLSASSFWDIGHYFWFLRELQAAGYPSNANALPEAERAEAFAKAYHATRNTSMNWVVQRILRDLYGVEITGAASVRDADDRVRASAEDPEWPRKVCERLGIRRIVVNSERDAGFANLPGVSYVLPRLERAISRWIRFIAEESDQRAAGAAAEEEISGMLEDLSGAGCRGVMTSNGPFGRLHKPTHGALEALAPSGNSHDDLSIFVLHSLCRAAETHGLFVQFFLGVESGWGTDAVPANDPDRILNLHGLFRRYSCPFELVLASDINNLDAVHAAAIYPNVHVGGMWWYNFHASTYRQSMQMRLESLPPSKCALVASDARCIEWCYGKILLVKRLMADFLYDQIALGWLDEAEALRVAREWLHDSAAALY